MLSIMSWHGVTAGRTSSRTMPTAREIRCPAAHNAVGLAGESPAVGIDCLSTSSYSTLIEGDLVGASSNGNVLERRASQLAGRNNSCGLGNE